MCVTCALVLEGGLNIVAINGHQNVPLPDGHLGNSILHLKFVQMVPETLSFVVGLSQSLLQVRVLCFGLSSLRVQSLLQVRDLCFGLSSHGSLRVLFSRLLVDNTLECLDATVDVMLDVLDLLLGSCMFMAQLAKRKTIQLKVCISNRILFPFLFLLPLLAGWPQGVLEASLSWLFGPQVEVSSRVGP